MTTLKTYVKRGTAWFFVSTERNETKAWEFDYDKNQRGKLLFMGESFGTSLHLRVCKNISEHGRADSV